jgi:16S rRNA (cytosine967-C5)-methyltransferase
MTPRVAPARRVAYRVLRRVFEQGAYADRALHAEAGDLDQRDRALALVLVYGTVQRRRTLDHILGQLSSRRPPDKIDPPVLQALRLGLFQLLMLDGITEYAAVHDSVELAKEEAHGGAGFVNALLRRAARERTPLLAELADDTPRRAALLHSVPDWLAELWWAELGADDARALLAHINTPSETAIRVNTLLSDAPSVTAALAVATTPASPPPLAGLPELPEGLILGDRFDLVGSELWTSGRIVAQSRAAMLVTRVLAPVPGERVLDLCAAPGGKTTHAAALMEGEGAVVAVEVHPGRARGLQENCRRLGADIVTVEQTDGAAFTTEEPFDRVIVDPPCSGLGTLQSRPDVRWRPREEELPDLVRQQRQILEAGARALRPGGVLVYSVCTITRAEGTGVVAAFLHDRADFSLEAEWQLLPHRDHTDGFYIARLVRTPQS